MTVDERRRHVRDEEDEVLHFQQSNLLDVLVVCRDFYFAGIKAFYGENTLRFVGEDHLEHYVESLDSERRDCVRNIVLVQADPGLLSKDAKKRTWNLSLIHI